MAISLETTFTNDLMQCTLTPHRNMPDTTWSFSLMAPVEVLDGGKLIDRTGGYCHIALPALQAEIPHVVTLRHLGPAPNAMNRAWTPKGSIVKHGDASYDVTTQMPLGAIARPWPNDLGCDELALIPRPTHWTATTGTLRGPFDVTKLGPVQSVLDLAERLGQKFHCKNGVPITRSIDTSLSPDAYRLDITANNIQITSAHDVGTHNALVSLLFLSITYDAIPCGVIHDAPRFEWRGQHLDCARHFFAPDTILRLLDVMALLKMNRFHWHFADDEAFRIPLASLPELSGLTTRGNDQIVPNVFGGNTVVNGVYTHHDIDRIQQLAASLHIDIVPEIEVPAHALGLCRLFPDTRDPNDTGTEESVQGYTQNVLNPAMPETWRIIETMIKDLADLFPGAILHLGGDELPNGAWAGSPLVDELKRDHGLLDHYDVQGWTMARAAEIACRYGMRPAAWEESQYGCQGGIGHNAILFSWTGQDAGKRAARMGHKVVMCPAQHTYLDMAHSYATGDWGASWAACFDLDKTVDWTPIHTDEPMMQSNVIGVQGTFWCEFTNEDWQLETMIAPRIFGVATMGWSLSPPDPMAMIALAQRCSKIWTALDWQSFYT